VQTPFVFLLSPDLQQGLPIGGVPWYKAACHLCMNCVEACPHGSLEFRFFRKLQTPPEVVGTVRAFAIAVFLRTRFRQQFNQVPCTTSAAIFDIQLPAWPSSLLPSGWCAAEADETQQRGNDNERVRQCDSASEASGQLKGCADGDEA
jgi:ferredoxin